MNARTKNTVYICHAAGKHKRNKAGRQMHINVSDSIQSKKIIESDSYRMGKQKNKNNGDSKDERN